MKIILKIVGIISAFVLSLFGLSGCINQESAVTLYDVNVNNPNDLKLAKNHQIEMYCGDSVKGNEVEALIKIANLMNEKIIFQEILL